MSSDLISTVLELVHGMEQARRHKELQQWQNEIGRAINSLLFSTDKLLDAMGQLGITIQGDLKAAFASEYITRLRGEMLNLEAIMASISGFESIPAKTKARLTAAVERIRTILYSGQNYGSAAVAPTLTAISVVDAVMRMADLTESEIAYTKAQFRTLLVAPLLNAEIPDSLVSIERALEVKSDKVAEKLRLQLRPVTLGTNPAISAVRKVRLISIYGIDIPQEITQFTSVLSGDIDIPESITSSPVESKALEMKSINVFGLFKLAWTLDPQFADSGETGETADSLKACDKLRAKLVAQAKSLAAERQLLREKLHQVGDLLQLARAV